MPSSSAVNFADSAVVWKWRKLIFENLRFINGISRALFHLFWINLNKNKFVSKGQNSSPCRPSSMYLRRSPSRPLRTSVCLLSLFHFCNIKSSFKKNIENLLTRYFFLQASLVQTINRQIYALCYQFFIILIMY